MITKKSRIFLLVFLTTNWINYAEPSLEEDCPSQEIEKERLELTVMPFNFRRVDDDNDQDFRLVSMNLSVNETVKGCMDKNKYNLSVGLDKSFLGQPGDRKIDSIATNHLINVGKEHLDIASCKSDDKPLEDGELTGLGLANGSGENGMEKEFIFFTASSGLWNIGGSITNVTISFEEEDKKRMCDYSGGFFGFITVYCIASYCIAAQYSIKKF